MKSFGARLIALVSTLDSIATASLSKCPTFVAKSSLATTYHISFYDNGNGPPGNIFQNVSLPANATVSSPWKVSSPSHQDQGALFTITDCTSTTQSSCSHGGCYVNYITTAQITKANRCLTYSNTDATQNATFSFQPCTGANATSQLFELSQYVQYSPGYASITSYENVDVAIIQQAVATSPFRAFWIGDEGSAERRLIEAITYPYTQAGLGVRLM